MSRPLGRTTALLLLAIPSPAPAQEAAFPPPPDYAGSETCTGYHVDQLRTVLSHIASCAWPLDPVTVSVDSTDLSTFSAVAEETAA